MTFFSKPEVRKGKQAAVTPQASFIDILYDHERYLRDNNGRLARPIAAAGRRIAVIGSGSAGLIAAYQLMQVGLEVDVYEADQWRYGGRIDSLRPIANETAIFELGAMRVPPSEKIFNYYARIFGMASSEFPDPGKVDTNIIFDGKKYVWEANQPPPAIFNTVSKSWDAFVETLNPLVELLKAGTASSFAVALKQWQAMINPADSQSVAYSNVSFYDGLVYLFVDNYRQYGLEKPWGVEEFALFGALGLGSGGFGSLYQVNFAEIVRLIVNGLETDQRFYTGGLGRLVEGFATTETGHGKVIDRIHYGCEVTRVERAEGCLQPKVDITLNHGERHQYDAVIVATTTRSMQVDMGITLPPDDGRAPVLDNNCNTGVRQLHLMNSSKLFVLTRSKFWQDSSGQLPENIQTDGLVRGLYCLDYPGTEHGVVLVSYTWGDDSTKYIAIKDANTRLDVLMDSLQPFVPEFINVLKNEVMREHTRLIDWQDQRSYYGAFKLNYPGQDFYNQSLYYQFAQSNNGIYIAGDSVSWSGGWIEGALQTGMNAAAAVIHQFSPDSLFADNPMVQRSQIHQYNYR